MRRTAVIAACLTALALAAGCGSGSSTSTGSASSSTTSSAATRKTVDTSAVEQQITTQFSTSSVKVTSVKCPSNVPVQKGATFTCTVYFSNSGGGKVQVTQQGANHYTYTLVPGSVTVPGSWADSQIEAQLAKQGAANAQVTCPSTIVVTVGTTVTCNVTGANGATGKVTFTFSNANGTVSSSSVNEG